VLTKEEIRDELLGALKEIVGGRTEIAEDDQSLENADELAAKLLAEELGAEIIPDDPVG